MNNPFVAEICQSLGLSFDRNATSEIVDRQTYRSCFATSELAAASALGVGEALQALMSLDESQGSPTVQVSQRLAAHWFGSSLHLVDPNTPAVWDEIAGDYPCIDGWIRLHTNAPHHKAAALKVLGVDGNKADVSVAVAYWEGEALEAKIVANGGAAARMRTIEEWANHPNGKAVSSEPLIAWSVCDVQSNVRPSFNIRRDKPLAGVKVLDVTRVIAGPVCTRTLAALGAEVLRIDPVDWDEPGIYEELTVGKKCAHLDLKRSQGVEQFKNLLKQADIFVHGLRADALERLGLGDEELWALNPNLINVSHNAYGWTGPWRNRRGFDSLVQMSSGIAEFGMAQANESKPTPLPVQALDHATGYLAAAAAIAGLTKLYATGRASSAKLSLARTAHSLIKTASDFGEETLTSLNDDDYSPQPEMTHLGAARRIKAALEIESVNWGFVGDAPRLRSAPAQWRE